MAPDRDLLESLNQAQRRAVTSRSDTLAILAGPGSGKTHTLTSRVAWLIDHVGYRPNNVIVATFTVKAAKEMKERIGKALADGREKQIILGTFHGIARRYLVSYGKHIGLDHKFDIADDNDARTAIRRICKKRNLTIDPAAAKSMISKEKSKGVGGAAAQSSTQAGGKAKKEHADFRTVYDEYQEYLRMSNLLDYDDLLIRAVQLLEVYPNCVSNVQAVLVDEYQDTNGVQYELMCKFAQARRRITVVGDPDQSIYGWRSAEIKNLHRLLQEFPGTDEVALEENYRSSQAILATSLEVIQEDTNRYEKILRPTHQKGSPPVLRTLPTAETEGEWIVSELRRVVMLSGDMLNYNDVAILVRSASLSRSIESALGQQGIPYRMVGGAKFFERAEVKLLLDYLRVIHVPTNNEALLRVINVPKRGIGKTTLDKLQDEAEANKTSVWDTLLRHCRGQQKSAPVMRKATIQTLNSDFIRIVQGIRHRVDRQENDKPLSVAAVIKELVEKLGIEEHLKATDPEKWESRWANVEEFIQLSEHFMSTYDQTEDDLPQVEGLDQEAEVGALGKFLSTISLTSAADVTPGANEPVNTTPMVTISTIHAAKGLEWPVVFVPAVYTGSMPHSRADDIDEERRLLFVALTRAQAFLYLSYPQTGSEYGNHGGSSGLELSSFITSAIQRKMAKQGPSFNQKLLDEVAKILRRKAPKLDQIYKDMPTMVCPEDTMYLESSTTNRNSGYKRQRTNGNGHGGGNYADSKEAYKQMTYSTTMDQASSFTVSSLPGFAPVSSYKSFTTPGPPAQVQGATRPPRPQPPTANRASNTRPRGQKSLLGFLTGTTLEGRGSHAAASPTTTPRTIPLPQQTNPLDPSIRNHTLGSHRHRKLPTEQTDQKHKYPMFSSSPPKEKENEPITGVKRPMDEEDEEKGDGEGFESATCFHKTTMTSARGGFARPAPLKRSGIAHIDRLRRPFKPLTINRQ